MPNREGKTRDWRRNRRHFGQVAQGVVVVDHNSPKTGIGAIFGVFVREVGFPPEISISVFEIPDDGVIVPFEFVPDIFVNFPVLVRSHHEFIRDAEF